MKDIDTSFIPNKELSFNDIAIYTERAITDDYNIFLMEYLLCEKDRFDEIILKEDEEPKLLEKKMSRFEKIKETIKKWIRNIWEKIKGFFGTILKKIKEIYENFKKNHEQGIADKFLKACHNIKDKDFEVKVFSESHLKDAVTACGAIPQRINQFIDQAETDYKKNLNIEDYKKKYDKDFLTEQIYGSGTEFNDLKTLPKFFEGILKFNTNTGKEMSDTVVKDDLFGRYTEWLDIDKIRASSNYIINIAFNNNNWIKEVQRYYDASKSFASNVEKNATQNANGIDDTEKVALLQQYVTAANNCLQLLIKSSSLANTTFQLARINYLDCVNKVILQYKKESKG